MPFDPAKHHRRSIRLKGYDYSRPGGYFVTVVTQGREPFFGHIRNDEMVLNAAGEMIWKWWQEIPNKYPSVELGTFVVMPNHFHGILLIRETNADTDIVGADLRVCPDTKGEHTGSTGEHTGSTGEHTGSTGEHTGSTGEHTGSPLPSESNVSLPQILQWFKTMTTNEYIRGVHHQGWDSFPGKLWQRNYYEHIIRDDADWDRIHRYIEHNPANWAQDDEYCTRRP